VHFDNLFFVLLIAIAGLLRWLSQRADASKEDLPRPGETEQPTRPAETQTEEERIRRFLEALGQPTSAAPPRRVIPRVAEKKPAVFFPKTPPLKSPLPPLMTTPPPLPSATARAAEPQQSARPKRTPAKPQAAIFEVRDAYALAADSLATESSGTSAARDDLLRKLFSQQGLRDAVILREIFGPPRGLQSHDPIGAA